MLIATRRLTLKNDAGDSEIEVRMFQPLEEDGKWWCQYEIDWPHKKRGHCGRGDDGFSAISFAMRMIASEIYASSYHKEGRLFWTEPGAGYGFPLNWNVRYLAIGDDKNQ
jgi:hypothetical protein